MPLALGIKNCGFQLKRAWGGLKKNEKIHKILKSQNVDQVDRVDKAIDRFVGIGVFK